MGLGTVESPGRECYVMTSGRKQGHVPLREPCQWSEHSLFRALTWQGWQAGAMLQRCAAAALGSNRAMELREAAVEGAWV